MSTSILWRILFSLPLVFGFHSIMCSIHLKDIYNSVVFSSVTFRTEIFSKIEILQYVLLFLSALLDSFQFHSRSPESVIKYFFGTSMVILFFSSSQLKNSLGNQLIRSSQRCFLLKYNLYLLCWTENTHQVSIQSSYRSSDAVLLKFLFRSLQLFSIVSSFLDILEGASSSFTPLYLEFLKALWNSTACYFL